MSSLLTNNSAMVALQTLNTINKNMGEVQNQISTGKRIATARDNAALWGISTTMQTDVSGFKAISESLSLGSATLSVGRDAAETVASLLDQMKGKIVAAQEENVDRNKIQADVVALRDQINTVVGAAQFNGLNLLNGRDAVNVLASLNRDSAGTVTSSNISFNKQDLTTSAAVLNVTTGAVNTANISATGGGTNDGTAGAAAFDFVAIANTTAGTASVTIAGVLVEATIGTGDQDAAATAFAQAINDNSQLADLGITASATGAQVDIESTNSFNEYTVEGFAAGGTGLALNNAGAGTIIDATLERRAESVAFAAVPLAEGDGYRVEIGGANFDYIAGAGDSLNDVAQGLATMINSSAAMNGASITAQVDASGTTPILYVDNGSGASVTFTTAARSDSTQAGGLRGLEAIDVTTGAGATAALVAMEGLIQESINAAAHFGSAQGRIQTQGEFVSKIMDGLTSGIGALVDADMEAASARLQALQVQQQLGIQALSIANQQPQNILALFRQ